MAINFNNYVPLNTYVLLAGSGISFSGGPTTISSGSANYGSFPTPTITGSVTGGILDNVDASNAQTNLTTLIGDINALGSGTALPSPLASNIIITPGIYTFPGFTLSGGSITFNGAGQYILNSTSSMIFTSGTIVLTNGATASNIYWNAPTAITNANSIAGNGLVGIFISGTSISISVSGVAITGNLYAKAAITLIENTILPVTICYMKGTKILTNAGYIAIEKLKVGDKIVKYGEIVKNNIAHLNESTELKPITWINSCSVMIRDNSSYPICFKKGSLGKNSPREDLFVSPGHRVIVDGKMVQSINLINGTTIFQDNTIETIEYFHLELHTHSVINAENVLSETFLDTTGNLRLSFTNE